MSDIKIPVILVVEDDDVFIKALRIEFEREKYEVIVGKDGEEGLSLALKKHPDIILLDIIMPKMDGIEMLQKLREDSWGKTVPVVILTNSSTDTMQSVPLQPSDYLIKSNTDISEVVQTVKELLNKKN